MKINVTQTLKDYKGKDILADRSKEKLILQDVIALSLNAALRGTSMTEAKKAMAFRLSTEVYASKMVKLTANEMAFIKERVAVPYSPLVYGRVCEIFGETLPFKKEKEVGK